jgi:hypothetical protein
MLKQNQNYFFLWSCLSGTYSVEADVLKENALQILLKMSEQCAWCIGMSNGTFSNLVVSPIGMSNGTFSNLVFLVYRDV